MKETSWKEESTNSFKKTIKLKTKCSKHFKQFSLQMTLKTGRIWKIDTRKIGCSKSKENLKLNEI